MKRVYIAYGSFEGPLLSTGMRRALEKRGFLLTDNIGSAHIVIAHSGGHLEINDRTQHEKILLIDPAFPNHTPIPINWLKHVGFEFRTILLSRDWPFFVRKYSIHLWYILFGIQRSKLLWHKYPEADIRKWNYPNVYITLSKDTTWRSPYSSPRIIRTFNASHGDCWLHPERYLDIL